MTKPEPSAPLDDLQEGADEEGSTGWAESAPASDTDRRLAEIRGRAEGATLGPWVVGKSPHHEVTMGDGRPLYNTWFRGDVKFLASAREDIPYLLDLVAQLRANGGKL